MLLTLLSNQTPPAVTLEPPLFVNASVFYSPSVVNLNVIETLLFTDGDFIFSPTITVSNEPIQPILGSGSIVKPRRKFRPAILIDLPEEEKQLPDVSAKAILAGLSATVAVGSVVATSPDPINSRASIDFTQIETYMRGVKAQSSWNDPSDEEMLFILDFALD